MLMTDGGKYGTIRIVMLCLIGRVRKPLSWLQITSLQTLDGYRILSISIMLRPHYILEKIEMVISLARRYMYKLHRLVRSYKKSGPTLIMSSFMTMPPCTTNMPIVHSLPTTCPSSLLGHMVIQNQISQLR